MKNVNVHAVQVMLQMAYAGLYILTRAALLKGLNIFVFLTYRYAVAVIALLLLASFIERKERPPLTRRAILYIILLGGGITACQSFYLQGLYSTSTTLVSAAANIMPVTTLGIAVLLRQEKLDVRSLRGQMQVLGTSICVGGGLVMCLYTGPAISFLPKSSNPKTNNWTATTKSSHPTLIGSIFVFGGAIIWSACIVFQGLALKRYPAHFSFTALLCLASGFMCAVAALVSERRNPNSWALASNIELGSIIYAGLVGSALALLFQGWTVKRKGPLFSAIYSPVCLVVTIVLDFCMFHVTPTSGSVLGAVLIVLGLYMTLWGKAERHHTSMNANNAKDEQGTAAAGSPNTINLSNT